MFDKQQVHTVTNYKNVAVSTALPLEAARPVLREMQWNTGS